MLLAHGLGMMCSVIDFGVVQEIVQKTPLHTLLCTVSAISDIYLPPILR
jgi:hypothetical protein